MTQAKITRNDIIRLFGAIEDHKITSILATGATHSELEQVAAWLAQADDVMGEMEMPLTGAAAQVYEIVGREQEFGDEDRDRMC